MRRLSAALVLFTLCMPAWAEADSDGYFCVGRGYLAYETRLPESPVRHELHVVRFGSTNGIVAARPVVLDDFQVHGMACGPATIELRGWNTVHSVDISDPERPKATTRSEAFNAGQARPAENLGHWARAQVINLDGEAGGPFQLVISRVSQRVAGGVEHHTVTRLLQRTTKGHANGIAASLMLFEGVSRETID